MINLFLCLIFLIFSLIFYWRSSLKFKKFFITALSFSALLFVSGVFALYSLAVGLAISLLVRSKKIDLIPPVMGWVILLLTIGFWKYVLLGFDSYFSLSFSSEIASAFAVTYMGLRLSGLFFDARRGQIRSCVYSDVLFYIFFGPALPAGPLIKYNELVNQKLDGLNPIKEISQGFFRITFGLFKKLVLLDFILRSEFGPMIDMIGGTSSLDDVAPIDIVLFYFLCFIIAYIDISAYTDLAIGIARVFGFYLPEDLRFPLFKRNISLFWQSWHITVVRWCRDNVFFPIFSATNNLYVSTVVVFLFMGLWHSVDLRWVAWGVYEAVGMILFYLMQKKKVFTDGINLLNRLSFGWFSYLATFVFSMFAFSWMAPSDIDRSVALWARLLGFG
jgi:alginate O-acetyltransferase complex protein AlgI